LALNCDIIELLENTDFTTDLVYIDPPYGGHSSDYGYMYQFLEEYIYGEKYEDLEYIKEYGKRFVNSKTYEENFVKMLNLMERFPAWLVSYNDSSWESKEYIVDLLKRFKSHVAAYEVDNIDYRYRTERKKKAGIEYIFYARN
jgi:adenine-specific DNA-methyltransferase